VTAARQAIFLDFRKSICSKSSDKGITKRKIPLFFGTTSACSACELKFFGVLGVFSAPPETPLVHAEKLGKIGADFESAMLMSQIAGMRWCVELSRPSRKIGTDITKVRTTEKYATRPKIA